MARSLLASSLKCLQKSSILFANSCLLKVVATYLMRFDRRNLSGARYSQYSGIAAAAASAASTEARALSNNKPLPLSVNWSTCGGMTRIARRLFACSSLFCPEECLRCPPFWVDRCHFPAGRCTVFRMAPAQQVGKVGKVGKVRKVGKVGKVGKVVCTKIDEIRGPGPGQRGPPWPKPPGIHHEYMYCTCTVFLMYS